MKDITSENSGFSTDGRRFFSRFYTNEATDGDNTFDSAGNSKGLTQMEPSSKLNEQLCRQARVI